MEVTKCISMKITLVKLLCVFCVYVFCIFKTLGRNSNTQSISYWEFIKKLWEMVVGGATKYILAKLSVGLTIYI